MKTVQELRQALAEAGEKMKSLAAEGGEAYDAAVKAFDDTEAALKRAVEAEERLAKSATIRQAPEGTLAPAQVRSAAEKEAVEKAPVAIMLGKMMEQHTGGAIKSVEFITRSYGETVAAVAKGQQLTDFATGGALSLPNFAETIIAGLENMTVVRRMMPQVLSVPGAMILPTETGAPSGSWLGENAAPTPGEFTFGDIRIDPKRLAVEAVISRRLLDQAARGGAAVRNLEAYIVRRLRERTAVNEDAGFLRGGGTQYVPLGLRSQVAAGNITGISGTAAANIETDLRSRVTKLQEANIIITGGYWIMAPRTRAKLADLRDANGNKIYPSIDENETLLGYRLLMTNQVPINLGGGGNESEIMFFNGPSIVVANGSDAEVRVSIEGSYQQGNEHRSLIQRNEMLIHMELYADIKLERPAAGAILTGVTY
jgi:HK97 family phage major capsid protein